MEEIKEVKSYWQAFKDAIGANQVDFESYLTTNVVVGVSFLAIAGLILLYMVRSWNKAYKLGVLLIYTALCFAIYKYEYIANALEAAGIAIPVIELTGIWTPVIAFGGWLAEMILAGIALFVPFKVSESLNKATSRVSGRVKRLKKK